jgi:antitoxin (DNA-binding transcriptional repressor) of toxin-antitoxin stability system
MITFALMKEPNESMAISKFKATCLAVLERVRVTGQPVRITRFGVPVADIVPPAAALEPATWLGALRGKAHVAGDLIAPVVEPSDWEALAVGAKGSKERRGRGPE